MSHYLVKVKIFNEQKYFRLCALLALRRPDQRHPRYRLDGLRQGREGVTLQAGGGLQADRAVRLDAGDL